ncbi:acyl-CoA dehydrogenase [Verticiella sediminum]|uniref:Acyl-CoA dehydrogenase n=1 Tax=Verticiella sediminum TaxID=1247510 RepID=A0A556AYS8_9BURK|nr:acyl-CoA dehydrogenase family protein [Verticiella sediminum]TSH98091.1 acyl-CoA dehydrogenase [Verticiella sediminum]
MTLDLTDDERRFREEVRAFIAEHLTPEIRRGTRLNVCAAPEPEIVRPWHQALHRRGWAAPAWPVEYGGTGWTPIQRYLFDLECARAGAPLPNQMGLRLVGPVIMKFGSSAQKARFLPRILSGDDLWCQGYSEPGAGSDLAALRTRAVRDGDGYVINGTKIWTGYAHYANWMFALVRTADTGRKQEGISFVLIDMATPGITVRPIRLIGGDHEVNQVFFDDLRIPLANRVGDEGEGWRYGKYLLEFERGGVLFASRLRMDLAKLAEASAALGATDDPLDDARVQAELTTIETDIEALTMIELQTISRLAAGEPPGPVASMLKLRSTEIRQAITRLGVEVLGAAALAWEPRRPLYALEDDGPLPQVVHAMLPWHLNTRAQSIYGGSAEIQRNILARALLGL